jgi:hypothetical protein
VLAVQCAAGACIPTVCSGLDFSRTFVAKWPYIFVIETANNGTVVLWSDEAMRAIGAGEVMR